MTQKGGANFGTDSPVGSHNRHLGSRQQSNALVTSQSTTYASYGQPVYAPSAWPEYGGDTPASAADNFPQYSASTNLYEGLQPEAYSTLQTTFVPSYDLPSVSASEYTSLSTRPQISYSLSPEQNMLIMGDPQDYSVLPPRDRRSSLQPSMASLSSVATSPTISSLTVPKNRYRAQRQTTKRDRTPPKNVKGEIYCDHPECASKNVTFRRPCEYNKHMDKHERPWKCYEPGCETNPGFTYSGGLLRHQREVHKMHQSTKKPLYCPYPNCNRSSGTGFTRRENLEEHKRRRHLGQPEPQATSPGARMSSASPASTTATSSRHMPPPQRKRPRHEAGSEHDDDDDEEEEEEEEGNVTSSSLGAASSASQRAVVDQLRREIAQRDEIIRRQTAELNRMRHVLGRAGEGSKYAPATTA